MMQEGGVILDIVLFVGICFVFGVFDLEIYFWCVVGCYSSTSRKSLLAFHLQYRSMIHTVQAIVLSSS
jgi:hypothetical protein